MSKPYISWWDMHIEVERSLSTWTAVSKIELTQWVSECVCWSKQRGEKSYRTGTGNTLSTLYLLYEWIWSIYQNKHWWQQMYAWKAIEAKKEDDNDENRYGKYSFLFSSRVNGIFLDRFCTVWLVREKTSITHTHTHRLTKCDICSSDDGEDSFTLATRPVSPYLFYIKWTNMLNRNQNTKPLAIYLSISRYNHFDYSRWNRQCKYRVRLSKSHNSFFCCPFQLEIICFCCCCMLQCNEK